MSNIQNSIALDNGGMDYGSEKGNEVKTPFKNPVGSV